jgi:DNA-binding NarL/FixJ family response regulator
VSLVAAPELQVVLVEDHLAIRKGVELLLRSEGMRVIGVADTLADGERMIKVRKPDVAIIDIGLGETSGLDVARAVLAEDSAAGILIYTAEDDEPHLREALDCGARGFALKSGAPHELLAAIRAVAAGGEYVDPRVAAMLNVDERVPALTPREREVVGLLAEGLRTQDIARHLVLSPMTVDTHARNVMRKLGARTRVHALAIAIKVQEIELP